MACNTGAREVKGEFLSFLDADDCVDVTYYHRAIDILKCCDNVSFVGCWADNWGEAEGYWPTWNPEPPYVLIHNPINTSVLIYRRVDFLCFGLSDPRFKYGFEDYDSMLSLLENGCREVAIPEPYFKYRVRGASMYHQASLETRVVSYEWLTQMHASFYREFVDEVVALLSSNDPGYLIRQSDSMVSYGRVLISRNSSKASGRDAIYASAGLPVLWLACVIITFLSMIA